MNNLNDATLSATTMGHNLVDEIRQAGHEFINNAVGMSIPIINTMAQTNINVPTRIDTITYYRKNMDDKILLICELPGVSKNNCKLHFSNGVLRIRGDTNNTGEWANISDKKYSKDINIGGNINENIGAKYEHGLLKITILKNDLNVESNIEIN
jgi:HSP20 family molecular chaperone IbpA